MFDCLEVEGDVVNVPKQQKATESQRASGYRSEEYSRICNHTVQKRVDSAHKDSALLDN